MYNIKNYFEINYSKYPFIPTNPNSDYGLMNTSGILVGGLIGGVSSGIQGGISAKQNGGNFWTGKGATFDFVNSSNAIEGNQKGTEVEFSTKSANQFKDKYFNKVKGVDKLVAENKLDPRLILKKYTIYGDKVFHGSNEIGRVTIYNGIGKGSDVFLFKEAFKSEINLFMTMGHEFVHVATFGSKLYTNHEKTAYDWNIQQLTKWGMQNNSLYSHYYERFLYYNKDGMFYRDFDEYGISLYDYPFKLKK